MAKNAVLSSFASGRQTSLVVDAGHDRTVGERAGLALVSNLFFIFLCVLLLAFGGRWGVAGLAGRSRRW